MTKPKAGDGGTKAGCGSMFLLISSANVLLKFFGLSGNRALGMGINKMFFRLYVLIQENLNNFNIEGIYSEDEIYKRKNYLNNVNPFNKYFIRGPFTVNNNNVQNKIITNPYVNSNNVFNTQNTNQFMTPNTFNNQHIKQFRTDNNLYNSQTKFKINDMDLD